MAESCPGSSPGGSPTDGWAEWPRTSTKMLSRDICKQAPPAHNKPTLHRLRKTHVVSDGEASEQHFFKGTQRL
eukprot:4775219-Lingulodinium_polyedra.AAC.1